MVIDIFQELFCEDELQMFELHISQHAFLDGRNAQLSA